jgi:Ca2+:H+ antiporter
VRDATHRLQRLWIVLLLAIPLAIVLDLADAGPLPTFLAAGAGIVPLAALMGRATDALAQRLGSRLGGLLNATFGNAAELILALVALRRGLVSVVKASLTGSIIGNVLLVLGMSLLVGGLRHRRQTFDRVATSLQATLLVVAAIGLLVPSALHHLLEPRSEVQLSEEVSVVLLVAYGLSLLFSFVTHGRAGVAEPPSGEARSWKPWAAAAVLGGATVATAVLSEILARAIESARDTGILERWGIHEVFLGVVVVAIIGNAAEHSTAVVMAYRNKVDVAMEVTIGSSLQIALFVTPVLVLASLAMAPQPLDLHFTILEVLAVVASVVVVALVASDGESHWMEGALLVAVYLILALAFYHMPAPP